MTGAEPRLTNAPGESNCTACHSGTKLNGGSGSVKIVLPGSATYVPGAKQHIQVQVSDPSQRRWGFEFSARIASSNAQAGDITSTDGNTRVECETGRAKPCSSSSAVQYITHTQSGTRNGTTQGVTFEFDWIPPSTDVGNIILYAVGNAANGNGSESGDHIYSTNLQLSPAAATSTNVPTISSDTGVMNGASFQATVAPNSWVTIKGSNLSTTTRSWTGDDLTGGNLPTSLDGVSVTINGNPAYVEYVSPIQINVVAPADNTVGPVEVRVTVNGATSSPFIATVRSFSPAFFTFDGKYLAATHADNSFLGKQGLFSSAPNLTTPAKPGETVVFYGTGFGPTDPAIPAGQLTDRVANIVTPYTITIGGQPAAVSFGGLVPPYADLYQFNVQVPDSVDNGDQRVVVQIGAETSLNNSSCCFITVQK
jgi:uncharacterized protein (TIGR03437 family)